MATTLAPGSVALPVADDDTQIARNRALKRFRKHKLAMVGAVVIALICLIAILAPVLPIADPNAIDQAHFTGTPLAPGEAGHVLGTDEIGRDLLARLVFGAQISLTIAFAAVLMLVTIGSTLGAIAGYYGGWVDWTIMRIADVFLAIPTLPLLLVLTAIVAASSSKAALGFGVIILVIGGLSWMGVARLVRASFLSLREKEFTEAARAVGNADARIIFRHLLPNAVAPIIVAATLSIADVILTESALSFLGFGIQPPTASWGNMLANAESNMAIAPWVAIFPGLCILVTVLSVNYLGDGLRDALDPKMTS